MLRQLRTLVLLLPLVAAPSLHAFTGVWSPMPAWQTPALCYGNRYWYNLTAIYITNNQPPTLPGNVGYTELEGPAPTLAQAMRMNVGATTYACDPTFVAYYGAEGVKAVDAAFAILNALPAASAADLSKFIMQGNQQVNYTARALSMLDLKSTVLQLMIEHMGLLGETHVFDMYAQQAISGGANCQSVYIVGVDNYDPVTWKPSTYVNGTSYDYWIKDGCVSGLAFTDAMEQANNNPGLNFTTSAVATQEALGLGGFYLGITRDDMGGLKYLLNKNNFRYEAMYTDVYPSGLAGSVTSPFNPVGTTNTSTNTNTLPTLVGGAEKVNFVKWNNYSPLVTNVTNILSYTITYITNGAIKNTVLYRTNTVPDIIISATNLLTLTGTMITDTPYQRTHNYIASPQADYPQVISPVMTLVINDVGPLSINESPGFMTGSSLYIKPFFQYGSFDGSTNPPIVFPQGTSLSAVTASLLAPTGVQSIFASPFNPLTTNSTGATGATSGTVTTSTFNPLDAHPGAVNPK